MPAPAQLPTLQPGIIHLDGENLHSGPLQALAINQATLFGGDITWIDTGETCTSQAMTALAPDQSILDRVTIARAFTAHQHHELVQQLPAMADRRTEAIVVPNIDMLYKEDPLLRSEQRSMMGEVIDILQREAERYQVPVITTSQTPPSQLEEAVVQQVSCTQTGQGARISTGNHRQLYYRGPHYLQTTLWFWEQVLQQSIQQRQLQEVTVSGTQ